jgi:hypothetical protein
MQKAMKLHFTLLLLLTASIASATSRTSANYTVVSDIVDAGGLRATSANYINAGSANPLAGISTNAAPAETAKHGYLAQLFDVSDVIVNATASTMDENATLQLAAWQLLDDATFLAIDPNAVTWSVASGPVTSVSAGGLATAGLVFQNTPATVQGVFGDFIRLLSLTVLDTIPDNFGAYAGDGIADDWQFQYFGLNNPLAAPGVDSDGDGQTNLFEFRAGYVPTSSGSRLTTRGIGASGGNFQLELSRVQAGTRYVIQRTTDFVTWTDILTFLPVATVAPYMQPLPTVGSKSFFRVRLEAP